MIDNLVLVLTHGLLAIAIWRLLLRPDLDEDPPVAPQDDGSTPDNPAAPAPRIPTVRAHPPAGPKMKLPPRA